MKGTALQHVESVCKDNKTRLKKRIEECTVMAEKMKMCPLSIRENMWDMSSLVGVQEGHVRVSYDVNCVLSLPF